MKIKIIDFCLHFLLAIVSVYCVSRAINNVCIVHSMPINDVAPMVITGWFLGSIYSGLSNAIPVFIDWISNNVLHV